MHTYLLYTWNSSQGNMSVMAGGSGGWIQLVEGVLLIEEVLEITKY